MSDEAKPSNFIRDIILEHNRTGRFGGKVITRFPPEPNGYLHIGHAKAICIDFGMAREFGGRCNLRFDDTNPSEGEQEYVDAIMRDVRWLGFDWGDAPLSTPPTTSSSSTSGPSSSSRPGKAYVCDLTGDQIREYRGTLTEPGRPSPVPRPVRRRRTWTLFRRMRAGEFPTAPGRCGRRSTWLARTSTCATRSCTGSARRRTSARATRGASIRMYDWAHGQSDSIEGVTHSMCTLEYEDHRPLYDWFLDHARHLPSAADRVRPAEPHATR